MPIALPMEDIVDWANNEQYQNMKERLKDKPIEEIIDSMININWFTHSTIMTLFKDKKDYDKFNDLIKELRFHLYERLFVKLDLKMSDKLIEEFETFYNCKDCYEYFRKID